MEKPRYIYGEWIDNNGSKNRVRYKGNWGTHFFTNDENASLLNGDEISFLYNGNIIRGHLQYRNTNDDIRYFGFCPSFDDQYCESPVFEGAAKSLYEKDRKNENLMNRFMRLYYYSKLINSDGTKVKSEFIDEPEEQRRGVDVVFVKDDRTYLIDEKAQMDYIYNPGGPLDTFALELLNSNSGKVGWFINEELKTEYYMFIWPHADERLIDVSNIEYASYALVERVRLKDLIEKEYLTRKLLWDYALKLSSGKLGGAIERSNKLYYKENPFDNRVYLVFTKEPIGGMEGKVEKPVNLVVKKSIIEGLAEDKGILIREKTGGNK